ncbi:MAG: HAMP domain-containing protein [Desulfomonile tiedjei]|nr:HAMP domain-containing protein [Desulfomonile tiedjei]
MITLRKSIAVKIALLVLGSTCLVLAMVLWVNYSRSKELIKQEAGKSARNLTASLANEIEQEFLLVAQAVEDLTAFLESSTWDEEALLRHIRHMVTGHDRVFGSTVAFLPNMFKPDVERFAPYFFRANGEIKFEQLGTESYNYFSKNWFSVPVKLRKPVWTDPYFDEGGGNAAMITYASPMFGEKEEGSTPRLRAVVTADISLEQLNKLTNSKHVYETGFLSVISDEGTFVTNRNPDLIMRSSIFDTADKAKDPRAKELARAMITEESGFYDIGPGITGVDSYLAFTRINPPGWTLAAILPKKELFAEVEDLFRTTILLAVVGIVLLVFASVLVARSISRPLRRMADETVKVAAGDLDIDLGDIQSNDEVGQLARAFTRMTEGLKDRDRIKDTFGRYLTQEVVKRLLDSKDGLRLGGEMRELSIMMSDLRGFTALTSTMSPEQVIKFLNRYLGKMVDIILDHRGIIDEIIGDGILAFFGAPEALENHPELAVACALKMQLAMEGINAQNEADGLPHLEMGVAVNTGEVVVGNIGSEKRAKYGAVGAQVNFTGRMESFTVGGQVLISKGTYEKVSDKLDVTQVLDVAMKGVPGKVKLYDVKGIAGQYEAYLRDRDETLTRIGERVPVRVFRLDQKMMSGKGEGGHITYASLISAKVMFEKEISSWEDIRMVVEQSPASQAPPEIYGKVISVSGLPDGTEGLVRFTSVSASAYELIRRLLGIEHSSGSA